MEPRRVYLEDVTLGERWRSAPIDIRAQEIIDFGKQFDPQTFHTDAEAAKASPFGGLIASGWHLASLVMRTSVAARFYGATPIIGLGVDHLRWYAPVRPGDTLVVEREVIGIETVPDKPRRGTVRTRFTLKNQREEIVLEMTGLASIPKRPDGIG